MHVEVSPESHQMAPDLYQPGPAPTVAPQGSTPVPPRPEGLTQLKRPARNTPLCNADPSETPTASSRSGSPSKRHSSPCPLDIETPVPQHSGASEGTLPRSHIADTGLSGAPPSALGLGGGSRGRWWAETRGTQHPPQSGSLARPATSMREEPP